MQKLDYVILDLLETSANNFKARPFNLGGVGGAGGGLGGPPGGFIGRLPQYRVAYDTTEAATLDTLPSGLTGSSGWSLVDNLNHIRYRLGVLESGGTLSGLITVIDDNNNITYTDVDIIHFSGLPVEVIDLGAGEVRVVITATGSGGGATSLDELTDVEVNSPADGDIIRYNASSGIWYNTAYPYLIVEEVDGSPTVETSRIRFEGATVIDEGSRVVKVVISGVVGSGIEEAPIDGSIYGRQNAGWVVIPSGGGELVIHRYNEDLTDQIGGRVFTTDFVYHSGTLQVYYNGIRQRKSFHYLDDVSFTTFSTYFDTYSGDIMIVDYDYYTSEQIDTTSFLLDSVGDLLGDSNGEQLTQ